MLHPNLKSFNHAPHKKYYAEVLLKSEFDKYQQFEQQQLLSNNNSKRKENQQKKKQLLNSLDDIFDLPISSDDLLDDKEIKTEFDRYIED
ncbi:unnamed protein product [Rotaria sordida]|uniref:Uncharacterized protein n=1 Tax=Rotaria sordida TaxID=392033 RepID=A0A815FQ09_9BILA|nr:unnamed protein product [Rotaria sordida]